MEDQIENIQSRIRQTGLENMCHRMAKMLDEVYSLMGESHGIVGYHLNGAVAHWGEFDIEDEISTLLDDYNKMLTETTKGN